MHADLHIDTRGQGPDVVVLHATPADPTELAELSLAGARLHVLHLPGYGASSANSDLALPSVEQAIESALARAEISSPIVVGWSSGAYRALSMTLAGRLRPRALALFGGFAGLADAHRAGLRDFASAMEAGADVTQAVRAANFSPGFVTAHPEVASRSAARALAGAAPAVIAEDLRAFAGSPDLTDRLSPLGIPVAVVVGEQDAATPPPYAEAIARGLGAPLERVPGAGHALHVERPDVWQRVVEDLVRRTGG